MVTNQVRVKLENGELSEPYEFQVRGENVNVIDYKQEQTTLQELLDEGLTVWVIDVD